MVRRKMPTLRIQRLVGHSGFLESAIAQTAHRQQGREAAARAFRARRPSVAGMIGSQGWQIAATGSVVGRRRHGLVQERRNHAGPLSAASSPLPRVTPVGFWPDGAVRPADESSGRPHSGARPPRLSGRWSPLPTYAPAVRCCGLVRHGTRGCLGLSAARVDDVSCVLWQIRHACTN